MSLKNPLPLAPRFADAAALSAALPLHPVRAAAHPARVLVLFGADWDEHVLPRYRRTGRYCFHEHGFDLFSFPSNAQLMWFDIWRFVDRMVERYRGRIDAVFSSNEQFGALAAALVAQRLGLPGADPASLLCAQHKYEARLRLREIAPDLCPEFELIPYTISLPEARRLRYPMFVKPVKATFSVLARRCDTPEALIEHLRFQPWERHVISRLIEPHNQALKRFPQFRVSSRHLLVEELLNGRQINVDGFIHDGRVQLLGISDELMYPGTMAFLRFACPGRVDAGLRARIQDAAERVLRGFGLTHGFFNLEFFVCENGELKLIEVNPRLAAQLAQMHEWVHGIDTYELGFAMALNRPLPAPHARRFGAAASFVWRSFDGRSCPRRPSRADLDWLAREFPQARLELYPKRGASLQREIKWLGSHRWAILNMPGDDEADLRRRYVRICARFGWPAPY
ncbi:ATP-grasp domain-containing protein [Piscinibacter sp.]|uniref:ATP-grasp domain-containing protein n=1 Tax=Piscinibacter sp. TaxID=1903157 RepID=UPI002D074401|nr:ATP-grasp domain-containing protein [Albitalea sp.]HUG23794.1 ATP-grasp domain-containing protein [Albitalea sp.]